MSRSHIVPRVIIVAALGSSGVLSSAAVGYAEEGEGTPGALVRPMAVSADEQRAVEKYWTPEKLKVVQTPGPGHPRKETGAEWKGRGLVSQAVGRLFFTSAGDGEDRSCTATVTAGGPGGTAVTAAHCLGGDQRAGGWNTNMYFIPGYRDGKAPSGGYTVGRVVVAREWTTARNPIDDGHDAAMLVLNPGKDGRSAARTVGAMPVSFQDKPKAGEVLYNFGYPYQGGREEGQGRIGNSNQGQRLLSCHDPVTKAPDKNKFAPALWGACDLGKGSSGGPHLKEFSEKTGTGTIVAINSMGIGDGREYGTHLGKEAETLYHTANSL